MFSTSRTIDDSSYFTTHLYNISEKAKNNKTKMKQTQNIVLMVEPSEDSFTCPFKIGNLFINRFCIEEQAAFEVIEIFELRKSFYKMEDSSHDEFQYYSEERKQKGLAQMMVPKFFNFMARKSRVLY